MPSPSHMGRVRQAGLLAAAAAVPAGLAYRFALAYRVRAGYPRQHPPHVTPGALGLPYETTTVRSAGVDLPAWFIPARDGAPGPGVVLVHGWESARDRTLPMAVFLHAVGYPLPDLRRPGPRGESARGAPPQRRRVRARHAGRARHAAGPSGGDGGRPRRALARGDRGHPGGRRRPADRGPRRELGAGGPVPPHAPDLPARPSAAPGSDRLPPRVADHARLPPAPRPCRPRRQRLGCDRAIPRPGAAGARRAGHRRAARPHGSTRRGRAGRAGRGHRRSRTRPHRSRPC